MAVLVNGIGYGPVLAPQDAMLDAGLVGGNNRILPCAQKMALTIVDSNTIRAGSGVMITSEGKRIQTMVGEYDDFSIPAGTAGTKSNKKFKNPLIKLKLSFFFPNIISS